MKMKHCTNISLSDSFLVIRINKERESNSVCTERRLNYIGNIVLVCFGVEICHILAGVVLVLSEVVIGSVSDTPKLSPSDREDDLKV